MSAKIYEFPARGRFAVADDRREDPNLAPNYSSPRGAKISSGAWYHEEAVEAERAPKN
jgi:hypothetical protein